MAAVALIGASCFGGSAWAGVADIEGSVRYEISGDRITIEIDRIKNNTTGTTSSRIHVTAYVTAAADLFSGGYRVARGSVERINGQPHDGTLAPGHYFYNLRWNLAYSAPPPGTYYMHIFTSQPPDLNAVLDHVTIDGRLTVGGGGTSADLVVESPSVDNTTQVVGASFTLSARVRNTGDSTAAATTLRYYRSADSTITTGDTSVGAAAVGGLAAGASSSESISLTAPDAAGTYYYGACADAVGGESDTSNNCSGGVRVTVEEEDRLDDFDVTIPSGCPTQVEVCVRDYSCEDGDAIRVSVNNKVIFSGEIFNRWICENVDVRAGRNDIEMFAINGTGFKGSCSHPDVNTGEIRVRGNGVSTQRWRHAGGRGSSANLNVTVGASGTCPLQEDDHGNTRTTATAAGVPSTTAGKLETATDDDYFRLDVTGAGKLTVYTEGSIDTVGELTREGGGDTHTNDDGGAGSNFRIEADVTAGTYYVRVSGDGSATGDYTLKVEFHGDAIDAEEVASRVSAIGDFNGDGKDDVLLRDGDGRWRYYAMNGRRHIADESGMVDIVADPAWALAGVGDLNGDGRDDILLRHGDGRWRYYAMYGRWHVAGESGMVDIPADEAWSLAGVGDFDGDGNDDILLRHDDLRWHYYRMGGHEVLAGSGSANLTRNPGWRVAGIGDLDGDGNDDVLLRKDTGGWYYYAMNGRRHISGRSGAAGLTRKAEYRMAGLGDFNGDGRDDVLLRRDDGLWYYYPMDGRRILPGRGSANLTRKAEWRLAGVGDFDGDGRDDVLLRKSKTTGTWFYYPMDGRRYISGRQGAANLTPDLNWKPAGDANDTPADDGNDTRFGASDLPLGTAGSGALDRPDDVDYWRIEVPSRGRVTIESTGGGDTRGRLEDADGNQLAEDDDGGTGGNFRIEADVTAGTYYVRVSGDGSATGDYTLKVEFHGDAIDAEEVASRVSAIGDFNGDGKDDVLLRDGDGRWRYYAMNGRRHIADESGMVDIVADPAWALAGVGDLNGDGRDDILLRHGDGRWRYYAMYGRWHVAGESGMVDIPADEAWSLAGVGDFDGDGNDDILLRHDDLRWHYYRMGGHEVLAGSGSANLTRNPGWRVAGIGDLDGDGNDDVLLRKDTGGWYYYAMNGRRHISGRSGAAGLTRKAEYRMAGLGDFNGDGRDDVLLRRDDGLWYYYPMDGRRILPGRGSANLTRKAEWRLAGVGDFDGDGRDDVLLRKSKTTGTWFYYPMDGRRYISGRQGAANLTPDLNWKPAGDANDTPADDGNDTRFGASDLPLGTAGSGALDRPDDVDYWRIEVPSRGRVTIESTGGTDTRGRLEDADGKQLAEDDDGGTGGNFRIELDLDAGTYYLRVSGSAGGTGAYGLRVSHAPEDTGGGHADYCPEMVVVPAGSFRMGPVERGHLRDCADCPEMVVVPAAWAACRTRSSASPMRNRFIPSRWVTPSPSVGMR